MLKRSCALGALCMHAHRNEWASVAIVSVVPVFGSLARGKRICILIENFALTQRRTRMHTAEQIVEQRSTQQYIIHPNNNNTQIFCFLS